RVIPAAGHPSEEGDSNDARARVQREFRRRRSPDAPFACTLLSARQCDSLGKGKKMRRIVPGLAAAAINVAMLTGAAAQTAELEAKDYLEIRQLMDRYTHVLDHCTNGGYDYADLFTPDGTFGVSSEWGGAAGARSGSGGARSSRGPAAGDLTVAARGRGCR